MNNWKRSYITRARIYLWTSRNIIVKTWGIISKTIQKMYTMITRSIMTYAACLPHIRKIFQKRLEKQNKIRKPFHGHLHRLFPDYVGSGVYGIRPKPKIVCKPQGPNQNTKLWYTASDDNGCDEYSLSQVSRLAEKPVN